MRMLLIILSAADREPWAQEISANARAVSTVIRTCSIAVAARLIANERLNPSHVVIDIGDRGADILAEIDLLAEQCEPGTRVVAVGNTNDIQLYRELIGRGVIDYFAMPASTADVIRTLTTLPIAPPSAAPASSGHKRVLAFMSAASGDGASTAALNTAYALSQQCNGNTVLVDMDYQFGMVTKQLSLQNQYGIRDLFDHPERGVDTTLIKRMVASYGKLHVITAPPELRYLPTVNADAIRELITALSLNYDNVVLDLPHVWLPWVATATQQATHVVLVAQLWLKSVSHAARMMRAFREINIPPERVVPVINRRGAKFKEAIAPKDFERVCGTTIAYTLVNDIKTIVAAEASGKTVMELGPSDLASDFMKLARGLHSGKTTGDGRDKRGGLLSILKG